MIIALLLTNVVVHGDYVRSDQLVQIWGSDDRDNFPNKTDQVQQRDGEDTVEEEPKSPYPKRYMDGMYGIGSQSYEIRDEILFLGFDGSTEPNNGADNWFSPTANSSSLGCNDTDYEYYDVNNKIG